MVAFEGFLHFLEGKWAAVNERSHWERSITLTTVWDQLHGGIVAWLHNGRSLACRRADPSPTTVWMKVAINMIVNLSSMKIRVISRSRCGIFAHY